VLLIALACVSILAFTEGSAQAEERCSNGVSLSYQYGNTIMEHAAQKANKKLLPKLREYVPSAQPIDFNRSEHIFQLNYDWRLRSYMSLRFYGGLSISPEAEVYTVRGDGYYKPEGADEPIYIGEVEGKVLTSGYLYLTGADLLFQTGDCKKTVHLVGGFGLALAGFHGSLRGEFDALITGGSKPDYVLKGSYRGVGGYGSLLGGVRFDLPKNFDLMVLGGYRAGLAYAAVKSDIKDGDGAMPIYGPFLQITFGRKF
jgi:hypothetical protein